LESGREMEVRCAEARLGELRAALKERCAEAARWRGEIRTAQAAQAETERKGRETRVALEGELERVRADLVVARAESGRMVGDVETLRGELAALHQHAQKEGTGLKMDEIEANIATGMEGVGVKVSAVAHRLVLGGQAVRAGDHPSLEVEVQSSKAVERNQEQWKQDVSERRAPPTAQVAPLMLPLEQTSGALRSEFGMRRAVGANPGDGRSSQFQQLRGASPWRLTR
jgi:hypothetical protein